MAIPKAKDMSDALQYLTQFLTENELVQCDVWAATSDARQTLLSNRESKSWNYTITASSPIIFKTILHDKVNVEIIPRIYTDITLDESKLEQEGTPFVNIVSVLEIRSIEGKVLVRFHIDRANAGQSGPLFHLQYGGHSPGTDRDRPDFELREPRWAHPPLDIILLCEVVVANYYTTTWSEIKRQKGWMSLIEMSQQLCLEPYFSNIQKHVSKKDSSLLDLLWTRELPESSN
jgi:hypothetical protein